eukprot:c3686_g1_i1.p1 GENE.c3686_g1_i1~~c3686_g1_i1.p1  ORF type:complete len:273 (+),score=65.24 c3686_g1_i1:446-1264(+)
MLVTAIAEPVHNVIWQIRFHFRADPPNYYRWIDTPFGTSFMAWMGCKCVTSFALFYTFEYSLKREHQSSKRFKLVFHCGMFIWHVVHFDGQIATILLWFPCHVLNVSLLTSAEEIVNDEITLSQLPKDDEMRIEVQERVIHRAKQAFVFLQVEFHEELSNQVSSEAMVKCQEMWSRRNLLKRAYHEASKILQRHVDIGDAESVGLTTEAIALMRNELTPEDLKKEFQANFNIDELSPQEIDKIRTAVGKAREVQVYQELFEFVFGKRIDLIT